MRCRSYGVMSLRRFDPTIHAPRSSDACRHPRTPCATTRISGSGDWTRNKISAPMPPWTGILDRIAGATFDFTWCSS